MHQCGMSHFILGIKKKKLEKYDLEHTSESTIAVNANEIILTESTQYTKNIRITESYTAKENLKIQQNEANNNLCSILQMLGVNQRRKANSRSKVLSAL